MLVWKNTSGSVFDKQQHSHNYVRPHDDTLGVDCRLLWFYLFCVLLYRYFSLLSVGRPLSSNLLQQSLHLCSRWLPLALGCLVQQRFLSNGSDDFHSSKSTGSSSLLVHVASRLTSSVFNHFCPSLPRLCWITTDLSPRKRQSRCCCHHRFCHSVSSATAPYCVYLWGCASQGDIRWWR